MICGRFRHGLAVDHARSRPTDEPPGSPRRSSRNQQSRLEERQWSPRPAGGPYQEISRGASRLSQDGFGRRRSLGCRHWVFGFCDDSRRRGSAAGRSGALGHARGDHSRRHAISHAGPHGRKKSRSWDWAAITSAFKKRSRRASASSARPSIAASISSTTRGTITAERAKSAWDWPSRTATATRSSS